MLSSDRPYRPLDTSSIGRQLRFLAGRNPLDADGYVATDRERIYAHRTTDAKGSGPLTCRPFERRLSAGGMNDRGRCCPAGKVHACRRGGRQNCRG